MQIFIYHVVCVSIVLLIGFCIGWGASIKDYDKKAERNKKAEEIAEIIKRIDALEGNGRGERE